jgi:Icc-related predicted phosphoesterase
MKISYCSDLHTEFLNFIDFKDDGGDVLVLAGDILTAKLLDTKRTDKEARKLAKYMKTRFKPQLLDKYNLVLYVPGNHEYYGSMYKDTIPSIIGWFNAHNFNNIFVMNNNHYERNGVIFIGATLWTDFLGGNYHVMNACQRGMNDYRIIGDHNVDGSNKFTSTTVPINAEFAFTRHQFSRQYINTVSKMHPDKPVVVITHMAPTFNSINKHHSGNDLDGAYASDLSNLILDNPNIKVWIHGHTHENVDYMVGNCRVLSNQLGYYFEHSNRTFSGTKQIEV